MKTKNVILNRSIVGATCAGAVMLMASGASAQNLLVANYTTGDIYEYTPGGTQSTFTSINDPSKLAFNSAGDLFVSSGLGAIYEVAPGGTQTTFATASGSLSGLAFAPVPEPSVMALAGLGAVGLIFRRRKN
jgi:hypothetical protein